ncbi:hypothetical protein FKG94_25030 [Exilibacterium tricleocarpae]|uniref:DSBA-like thioredoxin domain-containing protein n=1 Tax=Exilibacterium tricleocarpae TaxID=2591008 RepID=A0A545SSA3_9GAMM|nr:DsbA family protein [Exilibacterium tricleocarpae]TQV67796.1 hypothetical protein FKG94_25030 [Exilibacterium tricleocarpae]
MRKQLFPYVARFLCSDTRLRARRYGYEIRRRLRRQPHCVEVFLRIDDPYSYLLLQVLPQLQQRFTCRLRCCTTLELAQEMFPDYRKWEQNACRDGVYLAGLYGLAFPARPPAFTPAAITAATAQLAAAETEPDFIGRALNIYHAFWSGAVPAGQLSAVLAQRLRANERRRRTLGHYMSAMLYYGGEWYWGLDRLDHLERRLNALGLAADGRARVDFDRTYRDFCRHGQPGAAQQPPLLVYFSIRSPYSYLGLERAVALAAHYRLTLEIKPVLPMLMRGMAVPPAKKWYIFLDTKREARKFGIDYGFVADPLGAGTERCYALFEYARSAGKAVPYLLNYARAVNRDGIRSETDAGLKTILARTGLDWDKAKPLLHRDEWRSWADANLAELFTLGQWGVPCFKFGATVAWGQDRLDVIERAVVRGRSD